MRCGSGEISPAVRAGSTHCGSPRIPLSNQRSARAPQNRRHPWDIIVRTGSRSQSGASEGKNMRKASRCLLLAMMVMVSAAGTAFAGEDEDEDTFEQKVIKKIMRGLGADV